MRQESKKGALGESVWVNSAHRPKMSFEVHVRMARIYFARLLLFLLEATTGQCRVFRFKAFPEEFSVAGPRPRNRSC